MGYVETLPSGRHRGVPWNAAAGRRGKSKSFDRWSEADAYWRRIEAETDGDYGSAGVAVTRQQRGIPSFAAHVVEWAQAGIDDGELCTRRSYRSQAKMLAQRWPTERVDEITELMVRGYLAQLRDAGTSPSTRTLRLTVLRHAMRAAVKAGYRADDPTLGIKAPKRREHEARVLTEAELADIRAALPEWLAPAPLLSHDAGLRVSEIAGLRMTDLDLLHGTVSVVGIINIDGQWRGYPKSKIFRDIPLSARCLAALRSHVRAHPPAGPLGFVFGHPVTGNRLLPSGIRAQWDQALKVVALKGSKPTWHDLRHSCGTALDEAGVELSVIQTIMGHGSPVTTRRYVRHADRARKAAAVSRAFGTAAQLWS